MTFVLFVVIAVSISAYTPLGVSHFSDVNAPRGLEIDLLRRLHCEGNVAHLQEVTMYFLRTLDNRGYNDRISDVTKIKR